MNRLGLVSLVALSLLGFAAASSGARSASVWRAGSGVRVGGVYFHVVAVEPGSEALFRVGERLDASGLAEHPGCYRVGRAFYHRESCPVVQEHFRRHGAGLDSEGTAADPGRSGLASSPAPAAVAGGSHPIDYLRGSYAPPPRAYDRLVPWPGYGVLVRSGFGPRRAFYPYRGGFGPRGSLDPYGGGFGLRLHSARPFSGGFGLRLWW